MYSVVSDDRVPLVLLHPFPFDSRFWEPQVAALSVDRPVMTVDLPGFGESELPRGEPSLDRWADAVVLEIAAEFHDLPVALGGLSMGGYVALRIAARHPERVEALVLADTRAEADPPEGRAARDAAIERVLAQGTPALVEDLLPNLIAPGSPQEAWDEARRIAAGQSPEAVAAALAAMRDRPDSTDVLASLEVPVLVLVGEHDERTPRPMAEAMARAARHSWLVTVPGAGHLASLEAPEAFNAALRGFLAML